MPRSPARSLFGNLPRLEVVLTLLLVATYAAWPYLRGPIRLAAPVDEQARAPAPSPGPARDVLVVLGAGTRAVGEHASTDEFWLNAVEQHVGRARIADLGSIDERELAQARWLVITRRASAQLDPSQIRAVEQWVAEGGSALLEMPEGPWRTFSVQNLAATPRRATRNITSFPGSLSRSDIRDDLLEMPLRSQLVPFRPEGWVRGRDYNVLLEVDGLPGVVRVPHGKGQALLLLFEYSTSAVQWMQGSPDQRLGWAVPGDAETPETLSPSVAELVAEELRRPVLVPFLDLLTRNLLHLMDEVTPLARLWNAPGTHRGVLLVTHSEASHPELLPLLAELGQREGRLATYYVRAGHHDAATLTRWARRGQRSEWLGVLPEDPAAPTATWRAWRVLPTSRPLSLGDQLGQLNQDLRPYPGALTHRAWHGVWTEEPAVYFARLQALGVVMDTSLGSAAGLHPASREAYGYVHGTGLPFRPLDTNGHRFQLFALPVHSSDRSQSFTWQRLRKLTMDAANRYHTTLLVDARADTLEEAPSFDAVEAHRLLWRTAEQQGLWVTTMERYVDFVLRRQASHVTTRPGPEEGSLEVRVTLVGAAVQDEGDLPLTPSIALPARLHGQSPESLRVNGSEVDLATLPLTADRVQLLLALPPGEHVVVIHYGVGQVAPEAGVRP